MFCDIFVFVFGEVDFRFFFVFGGFNMEIIFILLNEEGYKGEGIGDVVFVFL